MHTETSPSISVENYTRNQTRRLMLIDAFITQHKTGRNSPSHGRVRLTCKRNFLVIATNLRFSNAQLAAQAFERESKYIKYFQGNLGSLWIEVRHRACIFDVEAVSDSNIRASECHYTIPGHSEHCTHLSTHEPMQNQLEQY